jgi:site-specific DNA recombinase
MAVRPKTRAGVAGPAEPVPVAILGRTSTLELQDPFGSITRQITSSREWLPPGFYLAAYYWDIESGGLDLEERGHAANYQPFVDKGLPRDGGLADLLSEARSPSPRFAAVVCEDIERSGRDTYNALKLERELAGSDILLFATDEPLDLEGTEPATILLRRTKQNIAEYFRLQLKQKMWRGMRTHAAQGYNLGKVLDGYLPDKVPHPAPSKAAQGRTKTLLALDEIRAPIIAAIYQMRAWEKLGVPTIHARLTADPVTYPAADPETGWTIGGLYAILANPKYTGYQVFGRHRKGRPVPPDKWYWSDKPTHPAIVDRDTWEAAQRAGAEHRSSRDGAIYNPANWRTYPFRSRVRCKLCKRRMCGLTKGHPHHKNPTSYAYYVCQFNPKTPGHVAAAPGHPRTVQVREDFLRDQTLAGLAVYALAPGREQRLAQLIPHTASEKKQQHDRQATALTQRLKRITVQQDNLMRELTGSFDMPDQAGEGYRRRIRADYTTLHDERTTIETQLTQFAADDTTAPDPDLVSLLPEVTADLADLPPNLQNELFAVFDIQIIWNAPMRQATFRATITDTTPALITALLARADDHPAAGTAANPDGSHPTRANTSTGPLQGSLHIPI